MERQLFAEYQVGSTLYGTRTPDSDQDVLRIYWPTLRELVSNQHVTIAQKVTDEHDIRGTLLGQFVMGLGSSLDNSLLAMHTEEFKELTPLWLSHEFLEKMLSTANSMAEFNQDKPKILAHAYRYWLAYVKLHNNITCSECGGQGTNRFWDGGYGKHIDISNDLCRACGGSGIARSLYPMLEPEVAAYRHIREGAEIKVDWHPTVKIQPNLQKNINKQALAEWVWDKYQNHYGGS